jgi:hypothetical protein
MDITTAEAVTAVATYLGTKLSENRSIQDFFSDFTEATVNWIKPIFITEDGAPTKVVSDFSNNPTSTPRLDAVKNSISIALEDNPGSEAFLLEMFKVIQEKQPAIVQGNNITQHHSGSGDNVGGNKYTQTK